MTWKKVEGLKGNTEKRIKGDEQSPRNPLQPGIFKGGKKKTWKNFCNGDTGREL